MVGERSRAVRVLGVVRRRLWRVAAVVAGVCSAIGAAVSVAAIHRFGAPVPFPVAAACVVGSALAGAVVAAFIVERLVAHRLRLLVRSAEEADAGDFLIRLPVDGEDELAETADALNRLFARITSLRVSVIDQARELEATRKRLALEESLAAKTSELQRRVGELQLVLDLLRVSVSETELDRVLRKVTARIAEGFGARELAIAIREPGATGRLVVRAAVGFASPQRVLGRFVDAGEGFAGEVLRSGRPVVLGSVASEPEDLAFWGEAPREGTFAALPISWRGDIMGILALTRPAESPFRDDEMRLLHGIADQLALAIRHARLVDELRALSTTDELTGLPNRRMMQRRLDAEIDRARRFAHPVSVVAIDIDHFKHLNDTCGHPTGDAALRTVAEVLAGNVRRVDVAARMGGEEFLVLLPETTAAEAATVAEKLRAAVAAREVPGGDTQPAGHLTISLGVATLREGESSADLVARADRALYAAKRRGRDRVVVHDEAVDAEAESARSERPPPPDSTLGLERSSGGSE
jgi:diguanylate cyclase (GGDEF)-like protein